MEKYTSIRFGQQGNIFLLHYSCNNQKTSILPSIGPSRWGSLASR